MNVVFIFRNLPTLIGFANRNKILHGEVEPVADLPLTDEPLSVHDASRRTWIITVLRASLSICALAIFVYVAVGAIVFPEWWYRVFWNDKLLDVSYLKGGFEDFIDHEWTTLFAFGPAWVALLAAIAILGLAARFTRSLLIASDRWMVHVLLAVLSGIVILTILLKVTQGERVEALNSNQYLMELLSAYSNDWEWTGPAIEPPVDFSYMDDDRVASLYSEFEPEFSERERTVSSEASRGLEIGSDGVKAEASKKSVNTSSYKKQERTASQKCIELINRLLARHSVKYFTNAEDWLQHEALRQQITAARLPERFRLLDEVTLAQARSNENSPNMQLRKLSQETRRRLQNRPQWAKLLPVPTSQQISAIAHSSLQAELSSVEGFVIVDGKLQRIEGPPGTESFEEVFAETPRRTSFSFTLKLPRKGEPIAGGVRLRVFGKVIRRARGIEIFPIAIY